MADTSSRDIELRLRARDLSTAELRQVVARVNELSQSLDKQLAAATRLEIKERELKTTLGELDQAAKNVSGLSALIQRYQVLSEQIDKQKSTLQASRDALSAHQAAMAAGTATGAAAERQLKGFQSAVNAAEKGLQTNSATLQRYNESLKQAGVEIEHLAATEQQLVATATQLGDARTKLNDTIRNYPAIERAAIAAIKERQEAERRAAAETATSYRLQEAAQLRAFESFTAKLATSYRLQEAAQLRAFESFTATSKAQAEGHAKVIAEVQAGVAQYKAAKAAEAAASIQAQEKEQLAAFQAHKAFKDRTAEAMRLQRQRFADETARARQAANDIRDAMRQANAAVQQVPIPSSQPRTDAMGRPGRGAAGQTGFLGLRPYELQNLGYQVNDVISGFASGQNATQILAQQGGQFIQIFGMQALRWFPLVAAAAGAVAVAVGAITHGMQTLASNREFTAFLTINKYAADQNVESLTNLRKELRDLGADWKDAGAAISGAVGANVRGDRIRELAITVEAMSRFNGKTLADNMKLVTDALNGGTDAFDKLLEQFPVFDKAQAAQIRRWLDTNQTAKAQESILRILSEEMKKAREQGMSPFEKETEKLRTTWNKFLDDLAEKGAFNAANQSLIFLTQGLTNMIGTAQAFFKMIEAIDAKFPWLKYVTLNPAALGALGADLVGKLTGAGVSGFQKTNLPAPAGNNADITKKFLTEKGYSPEAIAGIMGNIQVESSFDTGARNKTGHFGLVQWDQSRQAPLGGSTNIIDQLSLLDLELSKLDPGFKKAAQSAEEAALRFEKVFERSGGQLNNQRVANARAFYNAGAGAGGGIGIEATATTGPGVTSGTPAPQSATTAKIERDLRLEIETQRAQSKEIEAQLILERERIKLKDEGAAADKIEELAQGRLKLFLYDRNKAEHELADNRKKAAESDKNAADTKRAEAAGEAAVARAIKDGITNYKDLEQVRDRGAADERARISKERTDREALQELQKTFSSDFRNLELKHASDLAQALDAVNTKYKQRLEAIDKLKDRSKDLSDAEISKLKEQAEQLKKLEEAEARVAVAKKGADEALSARGDVIKTINRLEELGEITLQQKEDMTKKAYESSRAAILANADALEKSIDPARMSATEVEKLTNQVKLLRAETKYVDPFWKGLKDTFTQSFASAGDTFFNSVSEALGGAIAKTKEWKDVWQGLKNAAANFFAQILKDLANYIIKAQLAKLASSLFGGTSFGDFLGIAKPAATSAATSAVTAGTTAASTTSSGLLGLGFLGLHKGQVVGRAPVAGYAPASWWANAPRYHAGTIVGLAPDEQTAILRRGEEVISADNPRNILNGGGMGGGVSIRNVLVDDTRRIPEAMMGSHGEQVIIQHLVRNASTVREIVKG